jgi:ABC-2 type transport system ATP-binding protein
MAETMVLELDSLTKLYKNGRGVEDISFTLASGEVLGLLGPNGSGKTTTMKVIAGLLRPQSGNVYICGVDALDQHEAAMYYTGCLIEDPALYNHMTAEQNLRLVARFYKDIDNERIDEVLKMVDMIKYKKDKVGSFSLGMRQRVGLAAALISKPRLLILDEPANGLDIEGMVYVRETIKAASEDGSAVLISSHLANEIQQCATSAAIMHSGKLMGLQSMDSILQSFASLEDYFMDVVNKSREGG